MEASLGITIVNLVIWTGIAFWLFRLEQRVRLLERAS